MIDNTKKSELTAVTIQSRNWEGCIPIHLTLASTSVSSPTIPPPIHTLVPRNTYLHVGLQVAVQRLQSFALLLSPNIQQGTNMMQVKEPDPGIQSQIEEEDDSTVRTEQIESTNAGTEKSSSCNNRVTYPACWFEDEETKTALRWQYFVGILYDMKANHAIPWKIKLHFTNYPSSQILPLEYPNEVLYNVQSFYKHSLKQAMAVISGNSKSAMNVTKQSHGILWDAITNGNYALYQTVDLKIVSATATKSSSSPIPSIHAIPIRVFVNTTAPPIQRRIDGNQISLSLGQLLHEWLPEYFVVDVPLTVDTNNAETSITTYKPNTYTVECWKVCGIEPPLSTIIYDLWRNCSHPDHFLYVLVLTR